MQTGRFWRVLNGQHKATYLMGMHDGLFAGALTMAARAGHIDADAPLAYATLNNYGPPQSATNGEFIEAIDQFYADSTNVSIPIPSACRIVRMKFDGKSQAEIRQRNKEAEDWEVSDVVIGIALRGSRQGSGANVLAFRFPIRQ